jgi:hypothetical protein
VVWRNGSATVTMCTRPGTGAAWRPPRRDVARCLEKKGAVTHIVEGRSSTAIDHRTRPSLRLELLPRSRSDTPALISRC